MSEEKKELDSLFSHWQMMAGCGDGFAPFNHDVKSPILRIPAMSSPEFHLAVMTVMSKRSDRT